MRPKKPEPQSGELFRSTLEAILDPEHELIRSASLIDWERFDDAFGAFYHEAKGRRGLRTIGCVARIGTNAVRVARTRGRARISARLTPGPARSA